MPRLPVPGKFRKYILEEELPEGASGAVYRATTADGDEVVIKFFDRSIQRDATLFSFFTNEQLLLREMTRHRQHPHIVEYITHDFTREPFFLVTRYVEGGRSLSSLVGHPLHPGFALRVVEQIGSALDYAHYGHPTYSPIIHRDVKPANILIDSTNNAVLIDFSIARHPHLAHVEESGLGSPPYMPPEQYAGEEVIATDQFALAAVAYHMLSGKSLLPNSSNQARKKLEQLRDTHYEEVRKHLSHFPNTAEVLIRAMAYEPEQRYHTCEEFSFQLRSALRQDGQELDQVIAPPLPARGMGWVGTATMVAVVLLLAISLITVGIMINQEGNGTAGNAPTITASSMMNPTSTLIPTPFSSGTSDGLIMAPTSTIAPTSTPLPIPTLSSTTRPR